MLEFIIKGQMMMVPLMICSVLAVGVVIDRAWVFYRHSNQDTRALRARVMEHVERGELPEAATLCSHTPGQIAAVLLVGLQSYHKHKPLNRRPESLISIMKEAMAEYADRAVSAVEKRFTVLKTVGNAAPLLGMTGTVLGMISAFAAMAREGVSNEAVSDGISEALITTAAGLIIALIAIVPLNYFTSLSDQMELEIDESAAQFRDFVATRVEVEQAS